MTFNMTFKCLIRAFCILAFMMVSGIAAADAPLKIDGATTVDAESLIALLEEKEGLVLVDNRKPGTYNAGHIEGSTNMVSDEVTEESLMALLGAKDTPVVFYCAGLKCGRAAEAVKTAQKAGFTNIYYYAKGTDEWKELGLPMVTN